MREIKFRVWHEPSRLMLPVWKLRKDGSCDVFNIEVVENGYCDCTGNPYDTRRKRHIEENGGRLSNKHPVMQYAGLHDKNGKEIYEGDIVKICYGEKIVEVKTYGDEIGKGFEPFNDDYFIDGREVEVIGNIYENKDLLCECEK